MKNGCQKEREGMVQALQDTLEIISGKWKVLILGTLMDKPLRFKELALAVGISPRMLSHELQVMQLNRLITRTVYETKPVSVEYAITPYGETLKSVFREMINWGKEHRKVIMAADML